MSEIDVDDFPSRRGYALITGGSHRTGAAIARRLSSDGWRTIIHYHRSAAAAEGLADSLGRQQAASGIVAGDLADTDALGGIFENANSQFGFCSILVNNAAIFEYDDAATLSAHSIDAHYAVILRAPLLLTRHFVEQLPSDAKGLVVNLLDQKVFNLNPDFFSYTVAKAALAAASELFALALGPRIRVCSVAPGLSLRSGAQTETGFADAHSKTPLGFGSTPEDVAEAVSFIVRVPAMTGSTIIVDAGQKLIRRSRDVMFSYGISPSAPIGPGDGD